MTTEHILSYGYLTEDERRSVEAYVARHPELAPVLAEARTLFDSIHAEYEENAGGLTDEELLAHLVDTQLGHPGLNDTRIRRALDSSSALRSRYDALAGRLDRLSSAMDPVAHFEQLSGYRLKEEAPLRMDRPAQAGTRPFAWRRLTLAVGCMALALLAVAIPSARLRAIDRLAYIEPEELDLPGFDAIQRGAAAPTEPASPDVLYRHALSSFKHARKAGLGLFPRYEAALLDRAEKELERVIAVEPATSFLSHEARYTLARVYLAGDHRDAARDELAEVAAGESHRAAAARELLTRIAARR
ncbi:MAG: hypothetical protein SH809_06145 [Rhodothermales bacterium]|nr:hypothetical protein [Rhodothermales bacterium]